MVRAKWVNADKTIASFVRDDGTVVFSPLPPAASDILREYEAYLESGGVVEDMDVPEVEEQPTTVENWGFAQFYVNAGSATLTACTRNISSVERQSAGVYRLRYASASEQPVFAFPQATDPSNDRRITVSDRGSDYTEVRVTDSAGNLADSAEVYVSFQRFV